MPEPTVNGVIRTALSADRKIGTIAVHNSSTSSQDQFYPHASVNGNSSKLYDTLECKETGQRNHVTYHIEDETGDLTQTTISPNKNHVTAISVNSPRDVLKSFRRELGSQDTLKQNIHARSASVTIDDLHLNDIHYSNQHSEVPHLKAAGRYENADSDNEMPLQNHRPYSNEYQSNRRFSSDGGRVFETRHENTDTKMRDHATRGKYLVPRHQSLDLSKTMYVTKKQKHPHVLSKGDYVYGHPKRRQPQTSSRAFYPVADHYSDTESMNDLEYSNFDVVSVASSSNSDVFVTVDSSNDNHKKTKYQDIFAKRYTLLSERDFIKEIPIYSHKHNRRNLTGANRRYSLERHRSHSRPRQIVLSRHSRDSLASDDDDDDYSGRIIYTRRSSNRQRQKDLDILSLNRNGAWPGNATSLDHFSPLPYSLSTIPQGAFNSNFSLYPYTGLSPTFQNAYAGFPFTATPTHTHPLLGNRTVDFSAVRNYLGAMSASLASIPPPAIGTTPYISQQILQSAVPDTPHALVPDTPQVWATQDSFTNENLNYNGTSAEGQVVYRNIIEMQPSDSGAKFNEGQCLPVGPTSRASDALPSSTVGHTQDRGIDDSNSKTQGNYCKTDKQSKNVSELNPFSSHANLNKERSRLRSISENPTDFPGNAGDKTEQNSAYCEITDENKYKFNAMQRQLSKELSARFLSNLNTKEKSQNMSPVQSDSDHLTSSNNIKSSSHSAPFEPAVVSSHSDADRRPLKTSVATDSHYRTPKSPPPVTCTKPKSAGEKLTSTVSLTPLQQPVFSDSHNQQSVAANVTHLSTDDLSRSLGSNFFEISELKVIHIPENISQDVNHVAKNDKLVRNTKESSLLSERAGEKYSITQLCSPQISTLQEHPEADYDVYPRRSTTDTLPSKQQEKPTIFNGDSLPMVSPAKVRWESPKSHEHTNNNTVRNIINKFSGNIEVPSKHNPTPSASDESQLGLCGSLLKTSRNEFIPGRFPVDKSTTAPRSLQSSSRRETWKSNQDLVESTEEARRSSYKSPSVYTPLAHSAKSEQHCFNTNVPGSSHYVKLNDTDTDVKDTSYQFYTGPISLQPKPNNRNNTPTEVTVKNVSDSQARNVFDESFYNNTHKLRSDSISKKYIFYTGSKVTPSTTEQSINPLVHKTQQIPHAPNEDPLPANSQQTQQISPGTKISRDGVDFHPESDRQRDKDVRRSVKTEVPIPPRDFDSEADSCEYFYTSQGWTHKLDKHTTASVMFCTHIEDNSAATVKQLLGQTHMNPNESILDRFFRDCLPKDQHRLPDTVIPKAMRIFDRPFSDELSKSTVSLRWTSKLNRTRFPSALKNPIFGAVHQRPEANVGTSDLDSGVSSASQTSLRSLNDLHDADKCSILTPGEDYSRTGSVTSSSSIQMGWDYLSWNDSLQQKQLQ